MAVRSARARYAKLCMMDCKCVSEPGADRGPQAGSPLGVVDATGSRIYLEIISIVNELAGQHKVRLDPVATAPGSDTHPETETPFAQEL